jgi:hypothetical protein
MIHWACRAVTWRLWYFPIAVPYLLLNNFLKLFSGSPFPAWALPHSIAKVPWWVFPYLKQFCVFLPPWDIWGCSARSRHIKKEKEGRKGGKERKKEGKLDKPKGLTEFAWKSIQGFVIPRWSNKIFKWGLSSILGKLWILLIL